MAEEKEYKSYDPVSQLSSDEIRKLEITDLERIERFRRAAYGGAISDVLAYNRGIRDTLLSMRFRPLRPGMQLAGRALTVKAHTIYAGPGGRRSPEDQKAMEKKWAAQGGHPQERMIEAVKAADPGVVLCYDCGGDMRVGHIGEMTCQLAYAQGCRGLLFAGNIRDSEYILRMPDFPAFSFGCCPLADEEWIIHEINAPILLPGHLTHYVAVKPGDFVFGDHDGVWMIPTELVDEVLLQVEQLSAHENKVRDALAGGMSVDDVYRKFGVL